MAKINLTNQHNQENLGAFASLGVLMCMIVTLVGIKLWWFKHRLSFEQTSTQNGAAGGTTPPVIIPRRSKTPRYKKDKRYSQQIYDSGEVHGVFRQKSEDDLEIERPQQLPPVRIRQLSESASSLILPPPRTKRRDKVHSTAFEDLEIVTPPLTTASSSDLADIQENDTKISLTFEEFEKQFKLKEIKPEVPVAPPRNAEVIEIPVPPLRLNRSSSAMEKPEKAKTHYLKSSQSITIPEFHKVIERRPTGFSRPTEDLTKIDDYDEPKLFETFGERRPTGYIKYEEVDSDLQDQYERELNEEAAKRKHENLESPQHEPALEALRNERVIYNNDIFESPDVHSIEKYNFNIKTFKLNELEDVEYKEEDFKDHTQTQFPQNKENSSVEFEELGTELNPITVNVPKHRTAEDFNKNSEFYEDINIPDFKTIQEIKTTEIIKDPLTNEEQYISEYRSVKERRPTEYVKDSQDSEEYITEYRSVKERRPTEYVKDLADTEEYITEYETFKEKPKVSEEYITEYHSQKVTKPLEDLKYGHESTNITLTNGSSEIFDSSSLIEDFDNQFISWPQFEEKIEIPKVNISRFNSQDFEKQISFEEAEDFNVTTFKEERTITFNTKELLTENDDKFTLNQRRPTGFVRNWPESPELSETEEWQETSKNQKKIFSQVHSVITSGNSLHIEQREVTFNSLTLQNSDTQGLDTSPIKQRRPTGFVRNEEYSVTFNEASDEENSRSKQTREERGVEIKEVQPSKVTFEDSGFSTWAESDMEKFTLNQRRPTEYVRHPSKEELWNNVNLQEDSEDFTTSQVKFHNSTDFKEDQHEWNSEVKQRRPTGYIKKMELLDLSDEENDKETCPSGSNKEKFSEEKKVLHQEFETIKNPLNNSVRFQEMEENYEDFENNSDSLIKQRRPTGYVRKEEINQMKKQVNFELNQDESSDENSQENKALKQRRPTGFIRKEELNKEVNFQINPNSDEETHYGNEQLRQRRPTGFVRKEEITKEVNFQLNQNSDEESEFGNEQVKQRRHTGFIRKEETSQQVNFQVNEDSETQEFGNELLKQRRPTGFVKKDLSFLENPPPLYHPASEDPNKDFDNLWQEMEKEQDLSQNIEEEFAKIRHSYELNEGDFLELKSPESTPQQPLGFGKTNENNWLNLEKLKPQIPQHSTLQSPQEIKITFNDTEFPAASSTTTSILKEPKTEEDVQPKPRKSKVTFDFKTDERLIPARKTHEFEDSDYDDDVYDKPPPPIPPQPMQRMTNINYNVESTLTPIVAIPTKISLFGTQISQDDEDDNADNWSAIRKHRNLTVELQNVSATDSKLESPPPPFYTPPPKPSYRNPMAQLAIQRAKEARADLDGFKSRSINDKKPEASKRQRQKVLNLNNDTDDGTDA